MDNHLQHLHFLGGIGYLVRAAHKSLERGNLEELRVYLDAIADEVGAYSQKHHEQPVLHLAGEVRRIHG